MSSRNFLDVGLDLTLLPSAATNAQIVQAIRESHPADGLGLLIYQAATPDLSTYPEYDTFIWINTSTGELKWWNGTSWDLISGKATIADGTVTIAKLSATGGTGLQLFRVNAGATAIEFVDASAIFAAGTIAYNKLVNAAGAGYVIYSGGGGVFSTAILTDLIDTWLAATDIPVSNVVDVDGVGLPNQVAYITDTFNPLTFGYADQLLRNNQVDTAKLKFPAGSAGKYPRVNSTGTDFDFTTAVSKAAVLKYTGVTNTAAQAIAATTETTVEWNSTADTEGAISSFDAATDQITLATGTYLLDISIPIHIVTAGNALNAIVLLYDVTGAAAVATTTVRMNGGSNTGDNNQVANLKVPVKVTAATNVYSVKIYGSVDTTLGSPANLGTYAETYQQMSITKLS